MDEIRIDTQVGLVAVEAAGEPGFDVSLAIRPEHVTLEPQGASVSLGEAKVVDVVFQGSFKRVTASSRQDQAIAFIAKVPANVAIRPGDIAAASCRAEDIILLEH